MVKKAQSQELYCLNLIISEIHPTPFLITLITTVCLHAFSLTSHLSFLPSCFSLFLRFFFGSWPRLVIGLKSTTLEQLISQISIVAQNGVIDNLREK